MEGREVAKESWIKRREVGEESQTEGRGGGGELLTPAAGVLCGEF